MPNLTYKQESANSCGATALMVAICEMDGDDNGIITVPDVDAFPTMRGQQGGMSRLLERDIYNITAAGTAGYSMPDGLAQAALAFGKNVAVHMSGSVVPKVLEWMYPTVRTNLGALGIQVQDGTPALQAGERMLVAVAVGGLGLHWVLYRPDTTYMDPAYRANYTSLWQMNQLYVLRYVDMGVYVVIS